MNWPNRLTLIRVFLAPVFVFLFLIDNVYTRFTALIIFILAALTDLVDGWLARKYNITTGFGKFMDPLADKILISSALIAFIALGYAKLWMVLPIIVRDFFITGLRSLAAYKGVLIVTSGFAKVKTFLQMIAVGVILVFINLKTFLPIWGANWGIFTDPMVITAFDTMLFVTMAVTVWTGVDYLVKNFYLLKGTLW
ncbi:MAG: CDP-diacylglycerol--glycerol-3-phosphate 3-phosphatidyltransferase [candidate division Zixibacteria bacterium]|nr:CDP-diacylglycerol--glycerol-3-phosphate 3-phosphatidyltransferase [candidate division Zixibacteria bacterium]MBU1469072.1 CDP-diacylglycerol--glycerol-3-phosphate 3-phosphatidyltransferase [candidate division Zixibacteria bacterium]MBU2624648.1 CDP-diacylglycerol--glycerol-3-phosphate 3-phosphatidyltransferase [candidate division Zixibacteria bacterium]